jgi:nucleoside-diphosphate-sugar epimerase
MGGGMYYSSLQQHPMNHSFTHSRGTGTGTGTETDMETEWANVLNQRIAIIGANGYIGANLHAHLLLSHEVTGYDRVDILPHNHSQPVVIKRSEDISREEIQQYDVVIYLGGLTGRRDCLSHSPAEVFRENIWDPFNIAYKMKPSQLFVFASTSAVSEGSGSREHREDSAVNVANLDEYSRSMFEREVIFNQLSASVMISGVQEAPRLVGLRFGSVVGYSKSQRLNLAFMAMLRSAYTSVSVSYCFIKLSCKLNCNFLYCFDRDIFELFTHNPIELSWG